MLPALYPRSDRSIRSFHSICNQQAAQRAEPLVLPEVSRGANYAVYEDWVFDLFLLTL